VKSKEDVMTPGTIQRTTIAGFPALQSDGDPARPLLLFVHGAFVDHEPFAPWMTALARRGWRSVAVARRGRLGVGPERARGVSIADYVEDSLRVLDALGERPVVIGHSLGGLIAQKLAELDRCRAGVLLAPAPAAMLTAQPVAVPGLLPMVPKILLGRPVRPGCRSCERIALNRVPPADRARIHDRLVHESGAVYREMIFGTFKVDSAKVRVPLLVASGAQDRIVSPALARWTAERYRAELVMYEQHGHWLLEEPGWEHIVEDVGRWLERAN
jgi:pimeloyl-ACP methyl ester carboxylesterase